MNKTNPYLQQLHTAIDSTRTELLEELNQAQSARANTLSARDYAASDKWAAYKEMGRNEQVLVVASHIEEMAAHTQLIARNLTLFANDSQADASQAQSDMAEAAAAIKNAAGAMELLTRGVHDAASLTQSKDACDHINVEALDASNAVELCMTAVDALQTQSLQCSIIASTPLAGSVAQSFSVLVDQVASLVTDTTQARDLARQEVAATTANRNRTWSRYFTQIPPFERQLQVRNGLIKSFSEIDKLANYGLKVCVTNQKPHAHSKSQQGPAAQQDQTGMVPGIFAEVVLPADASGQYHTPVFYAVKELDSATFNFSSNDKGVNADVQPEAKNETKPASKDSNKVQDEPSPAQVSASGGSHHAH